MAAPEITLAIPVYNVEKHVAKSLHSALDQDFGLRYEVLIIDDRGEDRSIDIVGQVKAEHPHGGIVRIVRHGENLGLGAARNTAIDEARGRYLYFLDSDDCITRDCLTHLHALAEAHQADVVAGSTDEVRGGQVRQLYRLKDLVVRHEAAGVWMNAADTFMNIECWNKLYRLDFLRRNQIRTTHRIMEDSVFDFNVRALASTIVLTSHVTHYYNIREDSILGNLFGREASDEALSTYCDIIRQVQQLIAQRYHGIAGIYDLYCLRLFYAFYSIKKMHLTEEQEISINENLKGFVRFIPGIRYLKQGAFRCAYLACKITGGGWRTFEYIYDKRYTRRMHCLTKVLAWF